VVCSATKDRPSSRRTTVTRCNLCSRSDLSPMFPAARPTEPPASRRHAGRSPLPPSFSLVAAAVAPLRAWHVKPTAAYTKDVSQTECGTKTIPIRSCRRTSAAMTGRALETAQISLTCPRDRPKLKPAKTDL